MRTMITMTTQELVEYIKEHPEGGSLFLKSDYFQCVRWTPCRTGGCELELYWPTLDACCSEDRKNVFRFLDDFAERYTHRDKHWPWRLAEG